MSNTTDQDLAESKKQQTIEDSDDEVPELLEWKTVKTEKKPRTQKQLDATARMLNAKKLKREEEIKIKAEELIKQNEIENKLKAKLEEKVIKKAVKLQNKKVNQKAIAKQILLDDESDDDSEIQKPIKKKGNVVPPPTPSSSDKIASIVNNDSGRVREVGATPPTTPEEQEKRQRRVSTEGVSKPALTRQKGYISLDDFLGKK
jgi:hypothetical protein